MKAKRVVTFGEVLLRLSAPGYLRFGQADNFNLGFGGGEANVAVSLANYGIESRFVTRLPQNELADSCLRDLRGRGVDTSFVLRGGERMGLYFLETGAVARPSKVIYDRSHSAIAEIEPGMIDWKQVLEGAEWFHWTGITPAISENAALVCREAISEANRLGVKVSCDLNYRKKLWNYGKQAGEVMEELVEGCELILGNEEDAQKVFGIAPRGGVDVTKSGTGVEAENFESVCQGLKQRFPRAKRIVITLRGSVNANHNNWGGVLFNGSRFFKSPRYEITHIVDRVGAGDSFMGGLLYGLIAYPDNEQKALNFAAAASCLKHTIYGDYNQSSVSEVESLMEGDASGRVSR